MLSSETCQALRLLPEVAAHVPQPHETWWLYWGRPGQWVPIHWCEPSAPAVVGFEDAPLAAMWCPGLEDLLAMAQAHADCVHLRRHAPSPDGQRVGWGCEDCANEAIGVAFGDTPEEAVASFLIRSAG